MSGALPIGRFPTGSFRVISTATSSTSSPDSSSSSYSWTSPCPRRSSSSYRRSCSAKDKLIIIEWLRGSSKHKEHKPVENTENRLHVLYKGFDGTVLFRVIADDGFRIHHQVPTLLTCIYGHPRWNPIAILDVMDEQPHTWHVGDVNYLGYSELLQQ